MSLYKICTYIFNNKNNITNAVRIIINKIIVLSVNKMNMFDLKTRQTESLYQHMHSCYNTVE